VQRAHEVAPAFYATREGGGWRDWWTLLHPPYTLWHLSYVVIGGTVSAPVNWARLGGTLGIFFLGLGVAAHALDELHGHPLRTRIPDQVLRLTAAVALAVACALGIGVGGAAIVPWAAAGVFLVVGYNLELFRGVMHNGAGFAAGWGAFPVLAAAFVQPRGVTVAAVIAATAAFALSSAQRHLSTPARELRRRVLHVEVELRLADGRQAHVGKPELLAPLEAALRACAAAIVLFATALAVARATH
jgi:hypothetical protein